MAKLPEARRLVVIDIENWSGRSSRHQQNLRQRLRDIVSETFEECQLAERDGVDSTIQDRGYGFLITMPASVSLVRLLDPFVDRLEAVLRYDRRLHSAEARMRLRVAIHDGEVIYDGDAVAGRDVVAVCRIVDAEPLRHALAQAQDADLIVPVRVEECTPGGLLGEIAYIDLVGCDEARAADRLLTGLLAAVEGRAKPAEAPSFPGAGPPRTGVESGGRRPVFPGVDESEQRTPVREPSDAGSGAHLEAAVITINSTGGNVIFGGGRRTVRADTSTRKIPPQRRRGRHRQAVGHQRPDQAAVAETLPGHSDAVRAVSFSPAGSLFATGGVDGKIRMRSLQVDRVYYAAAIEACKNEDSLDDDRRRLLSEIPFRETCPGG